MFPIGNILAGPAWENSIMLKRPSKTAKCPRPASLAYGTWLTARLRNPAEAAAYLQAVIEDGDKRALALARRQVGQAQGKQKRP